MQSQSPDTLNTLNPTIQDGMHIAAIDMGSNSFHMVVAQIIHNEIRPLEKLGEKVQLGAGLDDNNRLDEASQLRAIACLERFQQRLAGMPPHCVQIVGTNALREARNADQFLLRAEQTIGYPVSVISGHEEARLIYLGVAHSLADDTGNRLVIDIGGGSTEFIIGERFEAKILDSLHMGCVSFRERFFSDGRITQQNFAKAVLEASREVLGIRNLFKRLGWQHAVGSSGSVKAVEQALITCKLSTRGISADNLRKLKELVIDAGKVSALSKFGIRKDRVSIFPAGLAILTAAFEVLGIEQMDFCDGALREGLLYDMVGRNQHEDVRERTINSMQERYRVDRDQATNVEKTAITLWKQVAFEWGLNAEEFEDLLRWSAQLHELGLSIAHNQYHKHGAYLLQFSEMPGFSRQTQLEMATIVRCHRRKITEDLFNDLPPDKKTPVKRLSALLRLAIALHHARNVTLPETLQISVQSDTLRLRFGEQWLSSHPLSVADLEAEKGFLSKIGLTLDFQDIL